MIVLIFYQNTGEWNIIKHNSIESMVILTDKTIILPDEKPQYFFRQQVNIPKTYLN